MIKMELYNYQNQYAEIVASKMRDGKLKGFIYNMDTGTGKTIMALDRYRRFCRETHGTDVSKYPPILIVAPASKVHSNDWQDTILKWDKFIPDEIDVTCISYNHMVSLWRDFAGAFVIFDEVHRLKNSTGVWGKAGYNLSKISCQWLGLSATPLSNGWIDSINYFKMFGFVKNKTTFYSWFCIVDNVRGFREVVDWKRVHLLKDWWHSVSKKLDKVDCLDLPPVVTETIKLPKTPRYSKIIKERMLGDELLDTNIKLRHAMRIHSGLDSKISWVKEMVGNTTQNVVIFTSYIEEADKLEEILKKDDSKTVSMITGSDKSGLKNDVMADNQVIICNYKAGSEGISLSYCSVLVHFSPPESYTEYYQALGRLDRIGQKSKITVYKLVAEETVDVNVYASLKRKKDFNFDIYIYENELGV